MKKIFLNIYWLLALCTVLGSCSKTALEGQYSDPDRTNGPTIEKLFSNMLDNNRVRPVYWDLRTMSFIHQSVYAQTVAWQHAPNEFQIVDQYIGQRWSDYYTPNNQDGGDPNNEGSGNGVVATYRSMQALYMALPLDERPNFEIFMNAGRVLLLDQTAQMIDLWGDMPYSEAGSLDATSSLSNPKFENQQALYDTVLLGLKNIADYFTATTLNNVAQASFSVQDFVMKGNLDKWRRFTNSLRLRYLMRISYQDPERAKDEIQTILASPIQYPLIDGDGVGDNYNPGNTDVLLNQNTTYTNNLQNAFGERKQQSAPDYMLNTVMLPVNDPRIPFMFDKWGVTDKDKKTFTPNLIYHAMPITLSATQQGDTLEHFSIWDSTTYVYNSHLPGVFMSAPEVNFLKAEAFERWGLTGGTAQGSYELAVRQSIAFIYYLYNMNPQKYEALTQPSTTTVDQFLAKPGVSYTSAADSKARLALIWTQKWLHFNWLQGNQAWAELRRTDVPVLNFPAATLPGSEQPPNRLIYPTVETIYNSSYDADLKAKDLRSNTIFWDVSH